jgi:hypothetical protein
MWLLLKPGPIKQLCTFIGMVNFYRSMWYHCLHAMALARSLEARSGIVGNIDNCNQDDTPSISICRHHLAEIK